MSHILRCERGVLAPWIGLLGEHSLDVQLSLGSKQVVIGLRRAESAPRAHLHLSPSAAQLMCLDDGRLGRHVADAPADVPPDQLEVSGAWFAKADPFLALGARLRAPAPGVTLPEDTTPRH